MAISLLRVVRSLWSPAEMALERLYAGDGRRGRMASPLGDQGSLPVDRRSAHLPSRLEVLMERRKGPTRLGGAVIVLAIGAVPLPAADLFGPLAPRYPVGDPAAGNPLDVTEGPKHLAAGDLDGDGLADVVTANLDGSLSVLLSRGDGTMRDQILVPSHPTDPAPGAGLLEESSLRAVELADLDGDRLLDAAAADIARGGVVVLLGEGSGTLTPLARIDFPAVRTLAISDLNGDGAMDLVAASSPPDCEWLDECLGPVDPTEVWCPSGPLPPPTLAVLPGRGDGSFGPPVRLLEGLDGCLYDVDTADLNRDGHEDVLALDYSHRSLLILGGNGNGSFLPPERIAIPGEGPRAFVVAFIDERLTGEQPPPGATLDVVVASRDNASLQVLLGTGGFSFSAPRSIPASPAPRDVAAADLDGDGWVELVTTLRYSNALAVFHALGDGFFDPEPVEVPAGTSPRHVVLADFTGDGAIDAAVNNRVSGDVAVFTGRAGLPGFLVSRNYYHSGRAPVDVAVGDFDGDGRPDTAAVSLRSHDLRLRRNVGGGRLGEETVHETSFEPAAVAAGDLDGDRRLDLVVGCLGTAGGPSETGSLLVYRGVGDGSFSGPREYRDEALPYRPVSLRLGDVSGDGVEDIATGGMKGELVLYRGRGDGSFHPGVKLPSAEGGLALNLTLGDFDGDSLLDIATSQAKLLRSGADFFSGTWSGPTAHFASGVRNVEKTWFVDSGDLDRDGRLDLMLALTFVRPDPIAVFHGNGDGTFGEPDIYDGPDMGVVASLAEDMDGDGLEDIVIGNRCAASVIILRGIGGRKFERSETVEAFSVEGLAVADMNGDGRSDLVGVGLGLWVLLNGDPAPLAEPTVAPAPRPAREGLVLNEIMTSNRDYLVGSGGETPDWVEIYNAGTRLQGLAGWKLHHATRDGEERTWAFPSEAALGGGQHLVVFCETGGLPVPPAPGLVCPVFGLHRGGGESLALLDAADRVVDQVVLPAMPEDVSYARDFDGSRFLAYNREPSMGAPNPRPVNLDPILEPGDPFVLDDGRIGVTAAVFDDVGIAYAAVSYRPDRPETAFEEIRLQDDGGHGDGLAGDGVFGAILPALPAGSAVVYSLRLVDLEGGTVERSSSNGDLFRVRAPPSGLMLRVSEVMPDAGSGLLDEAGDLEDWLEIENCGETAVSLDGLAMTKGFFDQDAAWRFPTGLMLAPGARLVVICDGETAEGRLHAGFRLDQDGDQVLIIQPGEGGEAAAVIDAIGFGPLPGGTAFGRVACGAEPGILGQPTPGAANEGAVSFRRGDAGGDTAININDAIVILNHLFVGVDFIHCDDAADADDSGRIDLTDAIRILGYLFLGELAPTAPFPDCGADPSADELGCAAFPCGEG
jgi:hypothetical protein